MNSPEDTGAPTPPAPVPGETWNLFELAKGDSDFVTMIGDYGVDPDGPALPPLLENLSLHFWRLRPGQTDDQTPHKQDEAYYVVAGSGSITVNGQHYALKPGDLVFVPRCAEHRFHDFDQEGITLLVFFAPNFTGP